MRSPIGSSRRSRTGTRSGREMNIAARATATRTTPPLHQAKRSKHSAKPARDRFHPERGDDGKTASAKDQRFQEWLKAPIPRNRLPIESRPPKKRIKGR